MYDYFLLYGAVLCLLVFGLPGNVALFYIILRNPRPKVPQVQTGGLSFCNS